MAEAILGIDLGTTNSVVAVVDETGTPRVVPARRGGRLTPSMVGFEPGGSRVVGRAARQLLEEHPARVAYATKRFIGRRYSEQLAEEARLVVPYDLLPGPAGEVRVGVAGKVLPVTQIAAMVLGELRLDAERHFGRPVSRAVITVPANFDDGQRQATREAATIAGLDVLRIVNEPTAAAVAYGLSAGFMGRALVFDLGGGTFDVSVLDVQDGVFEVLATGGDPALGGEDFDNRILQWLLAQIPDGLRDAVAGDRLSLQRLKTAAEAAKRELSGGPEEVYISVADLGNDVVGRHLEVSTALTKQFFESLCAPLTRRCLAVCETVMKEAALEVGAIDAVLLVGGMTRVPLIRKLVGDFFGRAPSTGLNPDEVVALGAAVHAQEIAERTGNALLLDVASRSLGVGTFGGRVHPLIPKNSGIPIVAKQVFLPSRAGQTEARIPIFQGESELAAENTRIGEVVLTDLQVATRAEHPIEVTFELSAEGTLTVRAQDSTTGVAQAVRIDARPQLASGEVDALREQESVYGRKAAADDQEHAVERFRLLLERGERFSSALSSESDADSEAAAAALHTLLTVGREALEANDRARMAEVSRRFGQLLRQQG